MHHYCLNCLLRFKLIQRRHGLWVVTIWRLCRSARVQSNKGAMVNKTGGTVASTFYTQDYFAPKIYVFFIHVLTLLTRIIDGPPMGSNLHCLRTQSILDSLTNYYFYNYSLYNIIQWKSFQKESRTFINLIEYGNLNNHMN